MVRAGHMGGDVFIIISCRELVRVSSSAADYVWTFVPLSTFLWAVETPSNWDVLVGLVSCKYWDLRKWPQEMNSWIEKKIELNYHDDHWSKVLSSELGREGYYGINTWFDLSFPSTELLRRPFQSLFYYTKQILLACGLPLYWKSPERHFAPWTPIWNFKNWSSVKDSINISHLLSWDNFQMTCISLTFYEE